jgi:hypothetical protein
MITTEESEGKVLQPVQVRELFLVLASVTG